jgi:hypothetical protein
MKLIEKMNRTKIIMRYYFKIKVEREIDKAALLEKCNLRHWGVKVKKII